MGYKSWSNRQERLAQHSSNVPGVSNSAQSEMLKERILTRTHKSHTHFGNKQLSIEMDAGRRRISEELGSSDVVVFFLIFFFFWLCFFFLVFFFSNSYWGDRIWKRHVMWETGRGANAERVITAATDAAAAAGADCCETESESCGDSRDEHDKR